MKESGDREFFECTLLAKSAKSAKVRLIVNNEDYWVPLSVCSLRPVPEHQTRFVLEVESWFAHKEGLGE